MKQRNPHIPEPWPCRICAERDGCPEGYDCDALQLFLATHAVTSYDPDFAGELVEWRETHPAAGVASHGWTYLDGMLAAAEDTAGVAAEMARAEITEFDH